MKHDIGPSLRDIEFEHVGRMWDHARIVGVETEEYRGSVGYGICPEFHKARPASFEEALERIVFGSYSRQMLSLCLPKKYSACHGGLIKRLK